jgi:hypothetical protein
VAGAARPPVSRPQISSSITGCGIRSDFLCEELRVIVEADGGQHADNIADKERTDRLQAAGYQVIRYWNSDIMSNLEGVLEDLRGRLLAIVNGGTPHPTLSQGERAS